MISKLTKEQVSRLTEEQQEVIGRLALDEANHHQALVRKASDYRGVHSISLVAFILAVVFWSKLERAGILIEVLAFTVLLLIQIHAFAINRRLNAILKLVELKRSREIPSTDENGIIQNSSDALKE